MSINTRTYSGSSTRYYSLVTRTYVTRSTYFYSGWGGYYGCLWCFSGPYAYGPVTMAGYTAPGYVDFLVFLVLLVMIIVFFVWLRRRMRSDTYESSDLPMYRERSDHHVNWP